MKKIAIVLVVIILIISCQSEEQKFKKQLTDTTIQMIKNRAFKDNLEINVLTYNLIEVDTVSAYIIHKMELNQMEQIKKLAESYGKKTLIEIEQLVEKSKLYRYAGMKSELKTAKRTTDRKLEDMEEVSKKLQKMFTEQRMKISDSLGIRDSLYYVKAFLKAELRNINTKKKSNRIDTIYFLLNKEYKEVKPEDLMKKYDFNF